MGTLYNVIITIVMFNMANDAVSGWQRPRGVPVSMASYYHDSDSFRCLDSSASIPFHQVNDDYCDCQDSSDEPGTSACPDGKFICENAGHQPRLLPSSWVDDTICDCCDGSDEPNDACVNTCEEMGWAAREEAAKQMQVWQQGHEIYAQLCQQATEAIAENKKRVDELTKSKEELQAKADELEVVKEEAEKPEKEAKDRHRAAWEVNKEKAQQDATTKSAQALFDQLNTNKNDIVEISEVQAHLQFDIDGDGSVSVEEAKEYLEDNESVNLAVFTEKVFPNIKDIMKTNVEEDTEEAPPSDTPSAVAEQPNEAQQDDNEGDVADEDAMYPEDDDEDFEDDEAGQKIEEIQDEDDSMPQYDAQTQALIDAANVARSDFNNATTKLKTTQDSLNKVNKLLSIDYGTDNQFYPLMGECFEFVDTQYKYKMCPFDKTSQSDKNGGMETSLGTWGNWDDKKTFMTYVNGQKCWNGPERSAKVVLSCGVENKLTSVTEPSRCEYQFTFSTPAACHGKIVGSDTHDEL